MLASGSGKSVENDRNWLEIGGDLCLDVIYVLEVGGR